MKTVDEALKWTAALVGETPDYQAARLLAAEVLRLREQQGILKGEIKLLTQGRL
jgi:hypothetical protein